MAFNMTPRIAPPLPKDGYGRRNLPYPYSLIVAPVQDYTYDTPEITGVPNDVCNNYSIDLTPDELLMFTSALQAGADLIYPTRWMDIMDWWMSAVQQVNTFNPTGCAAMTGNDLFCQRVQECLNPENGGFPEQDNFDEIATQTTGNVCFALGFAVDEIIEAGNIIIDLLEAANDAYDAYQDIAQRWLRYVPGIGQVVDLLSQVLAVGIPLARTVWNVQSNADAIRCEIYCAITDNVDPPYVLSNAILDSALSSAAQELPQIESLILQLADIFIPKRRIAVAFNFGVTEGGSDPFCEQECEPCSIVPECGGLDLRLHPYANNNPNFASNFVVTGSGWVAGEGYRGTSITLDAYFANQTLGQTTLADVNEVKVSFGGIGSPSASYTVFIRDASGALVQVGSGNTGNGTVTVSLPGYTTAQGVRVVASRQFQFEITGVAVEYDPLSIDPATQPRIWFVQGPCS